MRPPFTFARTTLKIIVAALGTTILASAAIVSTLLWGGALAW